MVRSFDIVGRQSQTERPTQFLPAAADPDYAKRRNSVPSAPQDDAPLSPSSSGNRNSPVRQKMRVTMTPTRAERPGAWLSGSGGQKQRRSWKPKHPEDEVATGSENCPATPKALPFPNLESSSHHDDDEE